MARNQRLDVTDQGGQDGDLGKLCFLHKRDVHEVLPGQGPLKRVVLIPCGDSADQGGMEGHARYQLGDLQISVGPAPLAEEPVALGKTRLPSERVHRGGTLRRLQGCRVCIGPWGLPFSVIMAQWVTMRECFPLVPVLMQASTRRSTKGVSTVLDRGRHSAEVDMGIGVAVAVVSR
jgi:hypothetical protein